MIDKYLYISKTRDIKTAIIVTLNSSKQDTLENVEI